MIRWHLNIISCIFICLSLNVYPQTGCTVPLPPVLISVSVQPETGKTDLTWSLSPSPGIAAYIIYSYKIPEGTPIDTLWNSSATSYRISNTSTKYFSSSYVVTAYRLSVIPGEDGCVSQFSNVLSTIFCSPEIDTCHNKMYVRWNNYSDIPKQVKEYRILMSVNGGPMTETYITDKTYNSFTINEFITDSEYCFVVKAVLEDGSFSTSNKSCLSTRMQTPPKWINADYASVDSKNKISLSFSVDPLSEITRFSLERRTGPSGSYKAIAQPVSVSSTIKYTDSGAEPSNINFYRLSAVNSCNIPVTISNTATNIVLTLDRSGDELTLSWNSLKYWKGGVSGYRVFIDTGNGFEEKLTLSSSDTLLKLGYKELMYDVSGDELCFYINAFEGSNPFVVSQQSRSSPICTYPTEIITVPNLFTPDNDLLNDLFRPVLSFTPVDYHLIISDRKNTLMFETRDHLDEWDGTLKGEPQPQGVYLWFLNVTTPSGRSISKTGTITIFRSR